jgi:hypothetical protein
MARNTGIVQRSAENGFANPYPVDSNHMGAYACLGMRSAFHHQGFETPSGQWLEVWWTTDERTGQVTDIFEDTRGLNRK